jgi:predicted KAP-like P-loop ATPase
MTTNKGIDGAQTLRLLSDKPLDDATDDRLHFAAYADALADLLDNPETDTPLTIAINAQWGAGKTSLAKLVEQRLEQRAGQRSQAPAIVCWFNAWSHDEGSGGQFRRTLMPTCEWPTLAQ